MRGAGEATRGSFLSARCLISARRAGEAEEAVDWGIRLKEGWKSSSLWRPALSVAVTVTGTVSVGDKRSGTLNFASSLVGFSKAEWRA